jgi:hypothetical protein
VTPFDATSLVAALAPELHRLLLPGGPEVLHLGLRSDTGASDASLAVLRELRAARRRPRYRPVDADPARVEAAASAARAEAFAAEGTVADPADPATVDALKAAPGGSPRLVLLLDNRLVRAPVPEALAYELRRLLRRGDHVLVDGPAALGEQVRQLLVTVATLDIVAERVAGDALLVLARPAA